MKFSRMIWGSESESEIFLNAVDWRRLKYVRLIQPSGMFFRENESILYALERLRFSFDSLIGRMVTATNNTMGIRHARSHTYCLKSHPSQVLSLIPAMGVALSSDGEGPEFALEKSALSQTRWRTGSSVNLYYPCRHVYSHS